ncbi:VWFA and cache domain-containing protein 1-like [Haliotis rufescens]|uniref:VWFA and cache domain-containing protein 1-like n=1 Tax=Haliotis rufescens TaxID=6454 RepID=UPI00201F10BF|nr:VWFA and cache domain-containing protein 1-like [Haliotis rufescens]
MAPSSAKHYRGESLPLIVHVILLFYFIGFSYQDDHNWIGKSPGGSGRIKLRNFDTKHQRRTVEITDEGYLTDNRQETVSPKQLGGIVIQAESEKLSAGLRWLSNDEIGITKMQAIFDSLPYSKHPSSEKDRLNKIAEMLRSRLIGYLRVLRTIKITVQHLYSFHLKQAITQRLDCCSLPYRDFKADPAYGCRISRLTSCDLIPPSSDPRDFNPGRNLTEVWSSNVQYFPSVKWQYFISTSGIHNEYPANGFRWAEDCRNVHDTRHRDVFLSTIQPQRKHVVIVVDHGNAMSITQLRTAKAIALHLLQSFSENDRIAVVGLAGKSTFPRSDSCLPHALVPATVETKFYFSKFVEDLEKQDTATNHTLGFETAFQLIHNTFRKGKMLSDRALILYVSRGLLSSLTEARDVMDMIAIHNAQMGHKVIINTYAVIDDGKPIMYEKSFLQDIANQNFSKYDVRYRLKIPVIRGIMLSINNTRDLSSTVGRFYLPLNRTAKEDPVFSLPYIDEADRGLTMSISQPCFPNVGDVNHLIGMVGVDLHMEDIVQDITYYNPGDGSYAFVVTTDGFTIMHPSFERPIRTSVQPMHTDIRHFENYEGFEAVRDKILNNEEGEERLLLGLRNHTNLEGDIVETQHFCKYLWKKVENVPYIVVIKVLEEHSETRQLKNIHIHSQPDLVYHRIDLLPTENMCLHLKQLATVDISTVFMSPSSFVSPFEHLSQEENKRTVQMYLAYLKDDTRLITNPGLKVAVRNDVAASSRINSEWIRRYSTSRLKDYIIRRYVATPSGVFRMFPGTLLDKTFDPTKRSWYTRAMEFPGHVTLTAPYLDVGGAGYIVTISHTIFEGKPAALHSPKDRVVAVMGMDITLGYFHKLLSESIPACEQPTVRCFLMEDKGYLVAHPGLIDPNGKGPVEQQHITHKEPLVANDILYHTGFVQKKVCNKYNDRTVQRFYNFNTSLNGVLTNMVHGEHCARYQMTHIPGTNAFLGIVNHTCETATAFCPCSMVDRLCLNCNRMEQNECECPCECPLEMNLCTGELMDFEDLNPSCFHAPEEERLVVADPVIVEDLQQCYQPRCDQRKAKMDCMGVLDCEWCQLQADENTPLKNSYCASQRECFGGVVGAPTPYGDEISAMEQEFDPSKPKSTPVGPVAGGIMGCFLLVALGVYCYRHHVHRNSHHYISTLPDNQNRMSHYYNEPDDPEPTEEQGAGHTNFVLASFENPASISPYRVNTSYRRPAGGDSDHGYSTMTPHEDSEHASLPCLEPLLIGKDRYKPHGLTKTPMLPPPPTTSRRSRSPTPPQTRLSTYMPIPEQTVIPSESILGPTTVIAEAPHSVIANVQVHMVDTH